MVSWADVSFLMFFLVITTSNGVHSPNVPEGDSERLILRLIPLFPPLLLDNDVSVLHPAMGVVDAFHSSVGMI